MGPEPICCRPSQGFRATVSDLSLRQEDRKTEGQRREAMPRAAEQGLEWGPFPEVPLGSCTPWCPAPLLHPKRSGPSHAVPSSQVPVHKLLPCQVLHAAGDLKAEADEVLHCGILGATGEFVSKG